VTYPNNRVIAARFPSKCSCCGKAVEKGVSVWFAKGYGVRCYDCGPHGEGAKTTAERKAQAEPSFMKIAELKQRLANGEKLKDLAKEVNVPWQKLWGILNQDKSQSSPKSEFPTTTAGAPDNGQNAAARCSDGVYRYEFSSVVDAVTDAMQDYAQNDAASELIRNRMKEALSGKDTWASRYTKDRFMDELTNPGHKLLKAVEEMKEEMQEIVPLPTSPRRRIRRGCEFGEEIDTDRFLARSPYFWERNVREQQPSRTVTIGCNLACSAAVKSSQLLARGAAALALADYLTCQGVNVSIVLFDSVRGATDTVSQGVIRYTVKEHTQPLDVTAVAFAMCEIAFFRVVGALGGSRHWPGKLSEGLGGAAALPAADRKTCDFMIDSNVLSEESAKAWLRSCMSREEVACG